MPSGPSRTLAREGAGIALLLALGVGARLAFLSVYPTLPFWDSLQLIHFGTRLGEQGLAAPGWYWAQFNAGLPMILAGLFRLFPSDPIGVARTATAVATGLLPIVPFVAWRGVLAYRWRLLAGALLALWPGQIFFAGVVLQDNWVMLPVIALGCLAARRQLGGGPGRPVLAGLLYAGAVAIRQEMLVVLLPLVLATALDRGAARRRSVVIVGLTVALPLLALCAQRRAATGRFSLSTEHGALGLLGSFMPGASGPGWIDARAYAALRSPDAPVALFGDQATLLRLTWEEVRRRPAFHALRIAAWLPRLAVSADADSLLWSTGHPRSQSPGLQDSAQRFVSRWAPLLPVGLALLQGLFLAALAVGWRQRNGAILLLSTTVLLKFLVHMIVSPLGRLVMPAIALELLVVPLGIAACAAQARVRWLAVALVISAALLLGTPALARFLVAHDPPVGSGVALNP